MKFSHARKEGDLYRCRKGNGSLNGYAIFVTMVVGKGCFATILKNNRVCAQTFVGDLTIGNYWYIYGGRNGLLDDLQLVSSER